VKREDFITALEAAFDKMITPLQSVQPALLEQPLATGKRSLREIAAYFIYWDKAVIRNLEARYQDREFDWSVFGNRHSSFAQVIADVHGSPLTRIAAEWQITHTTLTEALKRIPDEKLLEDGVMPRRLCQEVLEPYEQYAAKVNEWVEKLKKEGEAGSSELPVLGS